MRVYFNDKGKKKMRKDLFDQLYKNRLMSTDEEFHLYEEAEYLLGQEIVEDDIIEICKIFDDQTEENEVMWGLIHLIEIYNSKYAYRLTLQGISNMLTATEWAKIILIRCLNQDTARDMLKQAFHEVEPEVQKKVISVMKMIQSEYQGRFDAHIAYVINEVN